jgi:hypothetical protein
MTTVSTYSFSLYLRSRFLTQSIRTPSHHRENGRQEFILWQSQSDIIQQNQLLNFGARIVLIIKKGRNLNEKSSQFEAKFCADIFKRPFNEYDCKAFHRASADSGQATAVHCHFIRRLFM